MSRPARRTLRLAAAALAALGLVGLSGTTAHADTTYLRLSPMSNPFLVMDVSGGSTANGAKVIQWSVTGGDNQRWEFRHLGGGYLVVNKHSGKCLTTDGVAGHQLYQFTCVNGNNQIWVTELVAGDFSPYTLRALAGTLVVDVYGGSTAQGAAIDAWYNGGYAHNQLFYGTNA